MASTATPSTLDRSLTSEANAISTAVLKFNTRSDVKIKHKCPDLSYILGPIHDADVDENGVLNQGEYVTFADSVSGGYLTSINRAGSFLQMPLALQETYVVLSCLCELYQSEPWGGKGCCTVTQNKEDDHIGIRTNGTAPGESLTKNQVDYYTYVCGTMSETLDSIGADLVSPAPTMRPASSVTTMVSV